MAVLALTNPAFAQAETGLLVHAGDLPSSVEVGERVRQDAGRFVFGEGLIVIRNGADLDEFARGLERVGATIVGSLPALGVYRLRLSAEKSTSESLLELMRLPGVLSAERHATLASSSEVIGVPNDTWFGVQWQHDDAAVAGAAAGIGTSTSWPVTTGSNSVIVAVLDTGFDLLHPELEGRFLPGYDFVHEDPDPSTGNSHGTRIALVLAANANNGLSGVGVDWRCKILPIQVKGQSSPDPEFNLIQGIEYARLQGADIISMSTGPAGGGSAAFHRALRLAHEDGIIIVASAGNYSNADAWAIGASKYTMSIGATDSQGALAGFSSIGTAVDFVAPGKGVPVSWPVGDGTDQVVALDGTSYAAPIVAGVVALMKAVHPGLTPREAYDALRASTGAVVSGSAVGGGQWSPAYGHGLINAPQALDYLCKCLESQAFYSAPQSVGLVDGGAVSLSVSAGREHAGALYLILGSMSGIGPSVLGESVFPLGVDAYFRQSFFDANEPPLSMNLGYLDERGRAMAMLSLPPSMPAGMGGVSIYHAVGIWDGRWVRPLHAEAAAVSQPARVQVRGSPQRLFHEDFEAGLGGWTVSGDDAASWHLADDGDCGAVSRMAAFNEATTCTFTPGAPVEGTLVSPSFVMSANSPFTIEFDMVRDFAPGTVSKVEVRFVDDSTTNTLTTQSIPNFEIVDADSGGFVHMRFEVPQSSKFEGRSVHLEFVASSMEPAPATGWLIDNVVVMDYGALPASDRP